MDLLYLMTLSMAEKDPTQSDSAGEFHKDYKMDSSSPYGCSGKPVLCLILIKFSYFVC